MTEQGLAERKKKDIFKFDVQVLITTLRSRLLYIIFFSLLLFFLAGIGAKLYIIDRWEVRTVLLRHKKNMALQADVPYLYQDLDMNTIVQTIKLRRNLQEVIERLNIDTTPEKLFNQIRIELGRRSNIMHILTVDRDVNRAVLIGNTLADVFINSFVPIQNSSAEKIHGYYIKQKEDILEKISETEKMSADFNKENKLISIESETSIKFDQLRELELRKIENSMLISDYKTKIADYSSEIEQMPDEVVLTSTITTTPERQLQMMKEKLAELRQKYTDDNPRVIKMRDEIESFSKSMKETKEKRRAPDMVTYGSNAVRNSLILELNSFRSQLRASEQKVSEYDRSIKSIQESLKNLSESQRAYFSIKRELELYKDLLRTVESRIMEAKIAMESNISDFEILEYASVPPFPMGSGRKVIALAAGILGFMASFIFFAFRELTDFSFKSPFDVTKQLYLSCPGNIPDKDKVKEELFYAQFNVLMRDVLDSVNGLKPGFIALGSDCRAVGKSFVIGEILNFMADAGKKTLFIETLYEGDNDDDVLTLNECLKKGSDIDSDYIANVSENTDKAYFKADSNTLKILFEKENIRKLIRGMTQYDMVIWELFVFGYNIQLAADIISLSDKFYFVAGFRKSDIDSVEKFVHFLYDSNVKNISGILNKVDRQYLQVKF